MQISRRAVLVGGSAVMLPLRSTEANAFFQALMGGLRIVTELWAAYKVGEEIYTRTFGEQQREYISVEQHNYNTTIGKVEQNYSYGADYYSIDEPYKYGDLGSKNPAVRCHPRAWTEAQSLFCGCANGAVAFNPGFLIALGELINLLAQKYENENCWAYTRPLRYRERAVPWELYGNHGLGYQKKMSYLTPNGSVAMRWYVPDVRYGEGRVESKVHDRSSGVIVEGESSTFRFVQ